MIVLADSYSMLTDVKNVGLALEELFSFNGLPEELNVGNGSLPWKQLKKKKNRLNVAGKCSPESLKEQRK